MLHLGPLFEDLNNALSVLACGRPDQHVIRACLEDLNTTPPVLRRTEQCVAWSTRLEDLNNAPYVLTAVEDVNDASSGALFGRSSKAPCVLTCAQNLNNASSGPLFGRSEPCTICAHVCGRSEQCVIGRIVREI